MDALHCLSPILSSCFVCHLQESGGEGSPGGHVDMWTCGPIGRKPARSINHCMLQVLKVWWAQKGGRSLRSPPTWKPSPPTCSGQREARRVVAQHTYISSSPFLSERRKCLWACGLCYAIHGLGSPSTCQHPGACLTVPVLSTFHVPVHFFGGIK